MALPVDYFQPETFEQANPFLTGYNAVQNTLQQSIQNKQLQSALQAQNLQNQITGVQAQYALPEAQQELLKNQLSNQILQPLAQYAPQMTQAQLALARTMPGYYGAMGSEALAKIPLYGAQTQMTEAQIPYLPYQMMGKYYQGLGDYMGHSPGALVTRLQSSPVFQNYVANNPQAQANYAGLMQSILNNQVTVPQLPGMPGIQLNASPLPTSGQSGGISPSAMGVAPGMVPGMAPGLPPGMTSGMGVPSGMPTGQSVNNSVPTPYGYVPSFDASSVGSAASNAALKTLYTPQQLQQITYENSAENMFNQVLPDLPSITKYAGLVGKAGSTVAKYGTSLGLKNDPDYKKFVDFTQTRAPLIANELRRAYGGQATDTEREIMDDLVNPVTWTKSPDVALSQLQSLFDSMRANTAAITQPKNVNLQQALQSMVNPSLSVPNTPSVASASVGQSQMVTVRSKNGMVVSIPSSSLNEAIKRGAVQL